MFGLFPSGSLEQKRVSRDHRIIKHEGDAVDGSCPQSDLQDGEASTASVDIYGKATKKMDRKVSLIEFTHCVARSAGKWSPLHTTSRKKSSLTTSEA